eukprot:SAG31_NODE_16995_length_687_cov_1.153061_1_plen_117_part_00
MVLCISVCYDLCRQTVQIAPCAVGGTAVSGFKICTTPAGQPDIPAAQDTVANLCFDAQGIHIKENATDKHIFSPWTKCNDAVFVNSDVLEVLHMLRLICSEAPELIQDSTGLHRTG